MSTATSDLLWNRMTDAKAAQASCDANPAGPSPALLANLGLESTFDLGAIVMSGDPCPCNISHCSQRPCCY